jgi:RND family efflux transporter MFP subunit
VLRSRAVQTWTWYRGRTRWQRIAIPVVLVVLLVGGIVIARSGQQVADASQDRTVTLASVGQLSGSGTGSSIVGTVRSVTQADLLAESGGTVRSVNTTLGARVPAGFVIADLDNASQAAAVLQAEGAYESAVAARNITSLQSGNTQSSFAEAQNQARATYQTAFTTLDTALTTQVDTLYGAQTPIGPQLLISSPSSNIELTRTRQALKERMDAWRDKLSAAPTTDPTTLLNQASADTQAISDFLVQLAAAASDRESGASPAQTAALAQARATVNGQLSAISGARDAYNAKKTAAAAAGNANSEQGTQLAAANASVKTALGALRAAQAAYEKTRVRATIGGTVNYLPIKVGDYVGAFQKVATVANNGALEIVAYVPEDERGTLTVGMKVTVEDNTTGVITQIAPALDPTTKQYEMHVAVDATPNLVNGQSVRITLPAEAPAPAATNTKAASSTPVSSVVLLPLTAVKLLPDSRAVFTVGTDGRLVAHTVEIGDIVGDRITVTSGLTPDMRIVTDVRGLSEGQKVQIGETESAQASS